MRKNGVPNFPDPSAGGGWNLAGTGINASPPAVQAARSTCQKLLPGGGPPPKPSEQQKQQLVTASECMRSHGVTGFPDPVTGQPPANIQDYALFEGIGFGANAIWLAVPHTIDVNAPAFKHAATTCELY